MRPPLRLLTAALFASTFASPVSAGTPIFGTPAIPGVSAWNSPAFVDIDADGDLDLFVGDSGGNTFFYENVGTAAAPAFGEPTIDPFGLAGGAGTDIAAPTFGDIDADGDFDAFIGVRVLPTSPAVGSTLFYENTGTATAPAFEPPATNPFGLANVAGNASPELADVDDDGDLDAFVGENAGNTVFFENTGTASAPSFAAAVANPFGLADVGRQPPRRSPTWTSTATSTS